MTDAAKKLTALAVGAVLATASAYRQARDWLGARREQPFRG